jgi:hypothetical protein
MAFVLEPTTRREGRSRNATLPTALQRPATPHGVVLHADGSTSDEAARLNGYSIIQAEGRSEALELVRDHLLLALGSEYTIEMFELPRK